MGAATGMGTEDGGACEHRLAHALAGSPAGDIICRKGLSATTPERPFRSFPQQTSRRRAFLSLSALTEEGPPRSEPDDSGTLRVREPRKFEAAAKLLGKCFPKRDFRSLSTNDALYFAQCQNEAGIGPRVAS
jgi:hypothetical protein